ncbi:WD domain-containing protein [Pyricularia oryzae]|nr:WD domain-containing protein [Pyricularia oryzae]
MKFEQPSRLARCPARRSCSSPEALTRLVPRSLKPAPRDSGYGSEVNLTPSTCSEQLATVSRPSLTSVSLSDLYDGSGSLNSDDHDDLDFSEDDNEEIDTFSDLEPPEVPKPPPFKKSATLPRASTRARTRPALLGTFSMDQAALKFSRSSNTTVTRASQRASPRHADRFVPSRDQSTPTSEKFKTTKSLLQLSPTEKLLRHERATPDAFCFIPRRTAPMAHEFRSISGSGTRAAARTGARTVLGSITPASSDFNVQNNRQVSQGSVWTVSGTAPDFPTGAASLAIDDGRGHLAQSGTTARLFTTTFSTIRPKPEDELEKHEGRLAAALDIDRALRVLDFESLNRPTVSRRHTAAVKGRSLQNKTYWNGSQWINNAKPPIDHSTRILPVSPFKVLDAPRLRDDFYCSVLAYSYNAHTLAVGLGGFLYSWSEETGVRLLDDGPRDASWVTSIAFSSTNGGKDILAYGRSNKVLSLISLREGKPRIQLPRPNPNNPGVQVDTEDLLVGDEAGNIYYYIVEWPADWEVARDNWKGEARWVHMISVHLQQICGLSWSISGSMFASGGNDNMCCLFDTEKVLDSAPDPMILGREGKMLDVTDPSFNPEDLELPDDSDDEEGDFPVRHPLIANRLKLGSAKQRWAHGAAVKAIAFCPWQEGLVATGGGSNDKCIHFFHTTSGAALATIAVASQVTGLIWSTTRREIAATFGYAQPEHPFRIAIFSWPSCKQVAAIPWEGEHRALYAIPYPREPLSNPSSGKGRGTTRPPVSSEDGLNGGKDGCIVVAASDESVKFYEVWPADKRPTTGGVGMLGGSDILESLEGITKEGDVIR